MTVAANSGRLGDGAAFIQSAEAIQRAVEESKTSTRKGAKDF
jgi:hypothetical protein